MDPSTPLEPNTQPPLGFLPNLVGGRGCYLRGEDSLRVTTSAISTTEILIEGRLQLPTGPIQAFRERHVPNGSRGITSSTFHLGEGWLLDVAVVVTGGTPRLNQAFAWLDLVRAQTNAAELVASLASGPINANQKLSFPASGTRGTTDGRGGMRVITGTNPAANVEISETVPTGARWRIRAMQFDLVTDGNAANRDVSLLFDDGTNVYARVPCGTNHAASLTRTYSAYFPGQRNTIAGDTTLNLPLPDVEMLPGHRVRTVTTNRQVGDDFSAPQILTEEWLEV